MSATTWPTAPLLAAAGSTRRLCTLLGWARTRGIPAMLSDRQADRWAVACGYHPEEIWPGWCAAGLPVEAVAS